VGTGIGEDINGEPVVYIFVEDSSVISKLPRQMAGVPVVFEVTGPFVTTDGNGTGKDKPADKETNGNSKKKVSPAENPESTSSKGENCVSGDSKQRFERPVPIGVSAGASAYSTGTYGVRVVDHSGNLFMLGNNHIFAGRNGAPIGTKGVQPGNEDMGQELTDNVGTLATFEPLRFCIFDQKGNQLSECLPNIMDAAMMSTSAELAGRATPCDGYGIPQRATVQASRSLRVAKYGRTTGFTHGFVTATNVTVDIGHGLTADGNILKSRFENQVFVRSIGKDTFVDRGDAGSLVVTEAGNPVGLVFAYGSRYAVICPINPILERFGVTIDGL
jgi:hypothetical protein